MVGQGQSLPLSTVYVVLLAAPPSKPSVARQKTSTKKQQESLVLPFLCRLRFLVSVHFIAEKKKKMVEWRPTHKKMNVVCEFFESFFAIIACRERWSPSVDPSPLKNDLLYKEIYTGKCLQAGDFRYTLSKKYLLRASCVSSI